MQYITIFTDGSCLNNGKKCAKAGSGFYIQSNIRKMNQKEGGAAVNKISKKLANTNQCAELVALCIALKIVEKYCTKYDTAKWLIISDSIYGLKCIQEWIPVWEANGWTTKGGRSRKKVKNLEILMCISRILRNIRKIREKGALREGVTFQHIISHTKEPKNINSKAHKIWFGNYMADKLAKQAAMR